MNFTHDDLIRKLLPCREGLDWALSQPDAKTAWETCSRSDWMLWLLERIKPLTKEQAVRLAVEFAKRALPQFTALFPNDNRPAKAIESAEAWLDNPCPKTRSAAESAARIAAWSAESAAWSATQKMQAGIIRSIVPNPFK